MTLKTIALLCAAVFGAVAFCDYGGEIALDRESGIYKVGETVKCRVKLLKDGKALTGAKARMILKVEGTEVKSQEFETTGEPVVFSGSLDKPGWLYFGFEVLGEDGKALRGKGVQRHGAKPTIVTEMGALFVPEEIRSGIKRPGDFAAFWAERRAKLDKVPVKPILTPLKCRVPGIKLFAVEVPALGGYPVTGYLAYPENAKKGSLPAYVDWASWSPKDANRTKAINRAKSGAIGFAPTWHGRPVNRKSSFYNYKTTIKIRGGLEGIEDREKWCFAGMYYRVMRALDFVKSLPEWDGKQLISAGGSLGGAQSFAAAALDKDVTLAVIMNPCFCEFDGSASGRRTTTPVNKPSVLKMIENGDRRALDTVAYYDCVNLAPMIKCKVFVCTGGTDELCPPSKVYAAYNAIPSGVDKQLFFNPGTGHYGQISRSVAPYLRKLFDAVKIDRYVE